MHVRMERRDGAIVLCPEGEVDLVRSPVLRDILRQVQEEKPARLIVDLGGVEYMDSSGVATLVEALQVAHKNQTRMVLCGLKDRVRSIFEIARLDSVFTIAPNVEAALRA